MKIRTKQLRVEQGGNLSQSQINGEKISSTNFDQIGLNRGKKIKTLFPSVNFPPLPLLAPVEIGIPCSEFRAPRFHIIPPNPGMKIKASLSGLCHLLSHTQVIVLQPR
jgi:hypothetical protein